MRQEKPKILVITGPTASGKKEIALQAAEIFGGEIVSADSRKVYRYLDIGTAKPSERTREGIPHHLIDIVDPDESFSAGAWVIRAAQIIPPILARGSLPIISGGTGFYIKAFREGLSVGITTDPGVRESLAKELESRDVARMYEKLRDIDPVRAGELHKNDTFRIMRALEVFSTTGRTFTELRSGEKISGGDYAYRTIGIAQERRELYRRIDSRVGTMIAAGLLDELEAVLDRGYPRSLTALDTVGYKEWFPYLDGDKTFEVCSEEMKRNTRRYAKRQLTWFRAQPDIGWIDPGTPGAVEAQFNSIEAWLSDTAV